MLSSGKDREAPSGKWPAIKTSVMQILACFACFTAQQMMPDTQKSYRRKNHITQPATITPPTNMAKQ